MDKPDPISQFLKKLSVSLEDGSFVRLTLSPGERTPNQPRKTLGRLVDLKGRPHLSLTLRYENRDAVRNIPVSEVEESIRSQLESARSALLATARKNWQLILPQDGPPRLVAHKSTEESAPPREHDRRKRSWLDASARTWLQGLELVGPNGRVLASAADKYHQVERYLEILSHLVSECGWTDGDATPDGPLLLVADMGCGKGHLTFGVWHLLRQMVRRPIQVIGVEQRPALVAQALALAHQMQAKDLTFEAGSIASVRFARLDALIALHACNTATDEAILRGIELGATLILVAPCCHQELRPQLGRPEPLAAVLEHGLMAERMAEWATDGLRALHLQWAGYRTKIVEFVPSTHTPKNLLLAAVRRDAPFRDPAARARIEAFKAFFGIQQHALDPLLNQPATA